MKLSFHTLNPYWEIHNVPLACFVFALAGYNLLAVVASILSPKIITKCGEFGTPWLINYIICGVFLLMAAADVTPLWAVLLPAIFQITRELFLLWSDKIIHEHTNSSERATTMSMKSLMMQLSQVIYLPVFGIMTDMLSLYQAYLITALFIGFIAIIVTLKLNASLKISQYLSSSLF